MKENRFNDLIENEVNTKNYKLIKYRNIKEFSKLFFERVNPTHIIDVWGIPYKKYRKNKYPNYIRVGKILIKIFVPIFSMNLFNFSVIPYVFGLLLSFYFINYIIFIVDLECNKEFLFASIKDDKECLITL